MSQKSPPRDSEQRARRIERIVTDCRRRRAAGDSVADESLIEAHRDLMPELAEALHNLRLIEAARRQAERSDVQDDETAPQSERGSGSRGLTIRCPHCHNPIEIVTDTLLSDIICSACGSHFSIAGESAEVAERLADTLRRSGCDALNLRLHIHGAPPAQVREQIERVGTEVLPPLRRELAPAR